ncbi:uracil-DNA glycosylase [Mycetocola spongiae]|uniref:uracil-DNA glycosylase n=1 Tax=Mycetocola spongiae TaxID=2859226 RepID=UPI001CF1A57D|nr:uracil-DNA glycosylase [Mycetocola spongiae]UCR90249.1 uracil-DNA glycosylase [Mycetocola spongiae]
MSFFPGTLGELTERGFLHPEWAAEFAPAAEAFTEVSEFLAGVPEFLPGPERVLRVFRRPVSSTRVLIVGQDPYPTPGHAVGLAFAAEPTVRPLPRSVANIYRELGSDLGLPAPDTADLGPWAERGVMLLNRVLTVGPGEAGSHRGHGWERITDRAIDVLAARDAPLVSILWGRDARTLAPRLAPAGAVIEGVHPSPLSASRGFFGSRPFSAANAALIAAGAEPVDWALPATQSATLF